VVLMAGGMGRRLHPITCDCPKPLIQVGNKPILETILENFIAHGFRRFYISVNYKAEMIKKHFGDGGRWGVEIRYIDEEFALGTAGPLGCLPERSAAPIIVMNGDILTQVNFHQLLAFHAEHRSKATMCVREYDFQIPYGVINLQHHRLVDIEEKPVQRFFVNAGIYALEPEVISMIPKNKHCDMPGLFKEVLQQGYETAAFPVREYWMDVGRIDDLERAKLEYSEVFG
jgi:NDP-sugar pyrophosphorylase family protein